MSRPHHEQPKKGRKERAAVQSSYLNACFRINATRHFSAVFLIIFRVLVARKVVVVGGGGGSGGDTRLWGLPNICKGAHIKFRLNPFLLVLK